MTKIAHLLKNPKFIILTLIIVGGFLRLYNINWDQGHFLHPDERLYVNSSNIHLPKNLQEFFSPTSSLNPKMFYYGSFPLYLYKFINITILPSIGFTTVSRLISSILSILTIPLIFFLCKQFFSKKISIIAALIFTFSAGSIQHARFNTTESMLVFLLTLVALLSILMVKHKNYGIALSLGIIVGIAYATKIIGAIFAIIPFTSFIIIISKDKSISRTIPLTIIFLLSTLAAGFLFAPYQIIDYSNFHREQEYLQGVVMGNYKPPFTIIYEGTLPYIYQILKVFPFNFGFISLPLSIIGFFVLAKHLIKNKNINYKFILLSVFPIIYFAISGIWYAKFERYYILLFPFLSIWAAYFLSRLKNLYIIILLSLIAINGILFMRVYLKENTRIQASKWIFENIDSGSKIIGEHWDDNLPLPLAENSNKQYTMSQLAIYDQDSQEKISKLSQNLLQSDYFIISSRRVYYSILRNEKEYPLTSRFYKLLFEEKLGYRLEKTFTNYPFYFSDDFADESFQSYDHPPVIIFKNEKKLNADKIYDLITIL